VLEGVVESVEKIDAGLADSKELFALARAESDDDTLVAVGADVRGLEKLVADLEFRRMFNNPMDPNNCFVDINAGQGGTEAQDWTQMLLRMYLKYCDRKGFKAELLEESAGEVAGLKSASLKVIGPYAYGHFRTENGIHRLVRKSPFDSNARRHTSFASVFVLSRGRRVDRDRDQPGGPAHRHLPRSGAGGQHVNKTDSAVRITHLPTNTVVSSQNDRSQHRNRAEAIRDAEGEALRAGAAQAPGRAPEARGHEDRHRLGPPDPLVRARPVAHQGPAHQRRGRQHAGVLDGDLDEFITASLKQGV
jgi:peptide chain release factor 2